jgi:hypothetical protein
MISATSIAFPQRVGYSSKSISSLIPELLNNVSMDRICMKISTGEIGRSKGVSERCKIADGKAVCKFEWEFWVAQQKLRMFEKALKIEG